jgi:hypothetical protein
VHASALAITPVIDGVSLTNLVTDFERQHGFEPSGGYGGLIPEYFEYGSLDRYLFSQPEGNLWRAQKQYLLGCSCGEVGCWPLEARIDCLDSEVIWNSFSQPFRPDRDYSKFGPFTFDLEQYKAVVKQLSARFSS